MLDPILDISILSLSHPGILGGLYESKASSSSLCCLLLEWVILNRFHPGLNFTAAYSTNISTTNFLLHSRSTENLRSEWPKKMPIFWFTPVFTTENLGSFCSLGNFPVLWRFQQKDEVKIASFLTQVGLNKTRISFFLCVLCRPELCERRCGRWKSDCCYFLGAKPRRFHWDRKQNPVWGLWWKRNLKEKKI